MIGLDHTAPGISTNSARGPETAANNGQSGQTPHEKGPPRSPQDDPTPTRPLDKTAGQRYLTSNPVTARPMIIRWISLVPSKIVKLFGLGKRDQGLCS